MQQGGMQYASSTLPQRRSTAGDEELPPPPPVSPPRLRGSGSTPSALPGYAAPSMEEGESFRQANLPRRMPDGTQSTGHRLARPGEKMANGEDPPMYSVWRSSYKAMDEFGIGVGLYYRQLLLLSVVILICSLVYIPSMVHNAGFNESSSPAFLTGTAVDASREDLSLGLNGVPDLIVTLLLVVFSVVSRKAEKFAVEDIDVAQQTPQDYTVCIHNLPRAPGLTNPDIYHEKFRKYGEIVFIAICLKNGKLLKTVAKKRVIEHKINALDAHRKLAAKEESVGAIKMAHRTTADLKNWQAWLQQKLGLFATKDYLEKSLEDTKQRLQGLATGHYEPMRAYITFDSERAQRDCLKGVETGLWADKLTRLRKGKVNEEAVIGGRVCRIDEAEEPSEVLWEHIDAPLCRRLTTWMVSGFFSALFVTAAFFVLFFIFGRGWLAAIFIALINAVLPAVIMGLTLAIEEHKSLTHVQGSMMLKLVLARGVNSAFLLFISTKDTEQLDADTIQQILLILIADAFTAPLIRLTNVVDLLGRKLVGSRAKTQAEMNVFFQGAFWNLAERYTDMIKTVFVGLFYSAIVPTGLLVTAIAMQTLYWVDKYSLMRLWRRPPAYDASMSSQMRKYIALCIWLHLVMARIFFAKWPSQDEDELPTCKLFYCNFAEGQDFYSDDQGKLVNIYEILGILVFAIGGSLLVLWYLKHYAGKLILTKHEEVGEASETKYRSVTGIDMYVPLIRVKALTDPMLAIDVTDFPAEARSYLPLRIGGFYDEEELSMSSDRDFPNLGKHARNELFGKVKYYPRPSEPALQPKVQRGFLFVPQHDAQQPATVGGGDRFALGRQSSAFGKASFMLPGISVHEIATPQRPRWPEATTEGRLPSGWEQRTTGDGRIYFVCHDTRTSQWERPTTAVSSSFAGFQGGQAGGGIIDFRRAVRDLPYGWEVRYAADGRPYYVDHNTQKTHWEHPNQSAIAPAAAVPGPNDPSPGGTQLIKQYTSAGLQYHLDPRTNEVRWSPPRRARRRPEGEANGASNVAGMDDTVGGTSRGGTQTAGLPPGWERRTTITGREYFVNHLERITQWTPPEQQGSNPAVGEQKVDRPEPRVPMQQQVVQQPTNMGPARPIGVGGSQVPMQQVVQPTNMGPARPMGIVGNVAGFAGGNLLGYGAGSGGGTSRVTGGGGMAPVGQNEGGHVGLPGYIEVRVNAADGRTYYVNHRTQVTSWTPPPREDW